jgi:hypothetical protein
MSTSDEPTYELASHAPAVDDPHWTICQFHDPASVGGGGLTITVSDEVLARLTEGDLARPLTTGEVMDLDGR